MQVLRESPIIQASQIQTPNSNADPYLWTLDLNQVGKWMRESHALFPKRPRLRLDRDGNLLPTADKDANEIAKIMSNQQSAIQYILEQKDLQQKELSAFQSQWAVAEVLFANLITALNSASNSNLMPEGEINDHEPAPKRAKVDTNARDPFKILDPSFAQGKDLSYLPGAILSRLSLTGLVNALAGTVGGVMDISSGTPLTDKNTPIPTAANQSLHQIENTFARGLHHSIHAKLEMDLLISTPSRIVEMLCPEVSMQDIHAIRRRIYETVMLGKGTHSSLAAASLEGTEDLPLAARVAVSDIEKFQKCKTCGNNQQSLFVLDKRNGDLICSECGTVATESLMHEGTQFRKFEGEEDRNTHGDIANPLFSNAHNMSTTLGGMNFQSGPGFFGSKRGSELVLRNAHSYIEMNISQFGKDEKKTRIGYKDRQKKDAFVKMNHVGDSLSLHQAVIQRAKEFFASFRDDRELVQQFKGVVAACLIESFEQVSNDGKQLLKVRSGEHQEQSHDELIKTRSIKREALQNSSVVTVNGGFIVSSRSEAKPSIDSSAETSSKNPTSSMSDYESKAVSLWSLDDTRSWLLEASRSIARQIYEQKNDDKKNSSVPSLDELEGKFVEHGLELCVLLENEMKSGIGGPISVTGQRVTTPRVNEMGALGIKWQHTQRGLNNTDVQHGHGTKTSGQLLMLKSAKKLGEAMKDTAAGEAFYKELRALLRRQDERKKKELSEELTKQRLIQIQRKPWLQARVDK